MSNKNTNPMDIVATVLAEHQENSIAAYSFDGREIQRTDGIVMRNTLLLTILLNDDFLILSTKKHPEMEYDEFQSRLEMLLARGIEHEGKQYKVLGASSSLKDGKLWLATESIKEFIHSYFSSSQEALAYLGIFTSNCNHGIYDVGLDIQIVAENYKVDGKLITGDGEGYIPRSLLQKLGIPNHQIQVRLLHENWIGKGTLHPYDGHKTIIPRSMIKGRGEPTNGEQVVIVGIREIARELQFSSSWTLLQFFSGEAIKSTIPSLIEELDALSDVLVDIEKAQQFLGSTESEERFKIEAYFQAGLPPSHPYLNARLKKHLRKRYRDLALGSSVKLTGYMAAIADLPRDVICCPDKPAGDYVLTRYPIRDKLSFVKVDNQPNSVSRALSGSLYVCNDTILQLDGDYDGDLIVLIDEPAFTEEVGNHRVTGDSVRLDEGTKERKCDPLQLLPFVASEAVSVGNKVGYITYLINAAILNDRQDLVPILSKNLQLEVQSLKWSTQYDRNQVTQISEELEICETFRECKFNKKAFVSFVPDIPEQYQNHPLFIPYLHVQERFQSLPKGDDLLTFRYSLPIFDYDTSTYVSEASSVIGLYNGWISDILESWNHDDKDDEALNDALTSPVKFLEHWSESKTNNRKNWACAIWSLVHGRTKGLGIGSAAFHCFDNENLELLGKKPRETVSKNPEPLQLKTLAAVGGHYDAPGYDTWSKLNHFRSLIKELGRQCLVEVRMNEVDTEGKDFFCGDLRLGSLPRDQFQQFGDLRVGDNFEAVITQRGKAVYLHTFND